MEKQEGEIKTTGKHIGNTLKEELANLTVVAKFATTAEKTVVRYDGTNK
ncbi:MULTISPECIES: hypothetical protein [unclassified Bacteroides]|nr:MULTISPECIES: hypothetical protein [unclassified Bacteroides]MDO3389226.1 hypothetical protein [Bacteroides sp. ET489]